MAYQDIPAGATPGAGAGSGQVSSGASDSTGNFLGSELTTTPADITIAVTGSPGTDQKTNLSLPALGPGAVTTGSTDTPVLSVTTDNRGRTTGVGTWAASDVPASWSKTLVRYILVDYDGGNDSNLGYVDAAAGSTIVPTGLAKKTFDAGVMPILPRTGNGRKVVILVKNRAAGATYLDSDGVTLSDVDLSVCSGYAFASIRGSTDLTNSVTDRLLCGGVVGFAGPNGDSSWTATAGATVKQLTIAAGSLPAEPAASSAALTAHVIGMRLRFSGNVTAGIANINNVCWRNGTGTSTVEFGQDVGTAPANGDTFFLERPGVRFNTFKDFNSRNLPSGASTVSSVSARGFTVGIGVVSTTATPSFLFGTNGGGPYHTYAFCEAEGGSGWVTNVAGSRFFLSPAYNDETGTAREVGVGLRSRNFCFFTGGNVVSFAGAGQQAAGMSVVARGLFAFAFVGVTDVPRFSIGGGCYVSDGLMIMAPPSSFPSFAGNAASATVARLRIVRAGSGLGLGAAGVAASGAVLLSGIEFQDCTTGPCILVNSFGSAGWIAINNCVAAAAGGNTQYGLTFGTLSTHQTYVEITTASVTVTGTLGDIRFQTDAVITTWAGLALTNIVDRLGNRICSSTTGNLIEGPAILVTNKEGAALAVGNIVRGNGTASQVVKAFADTEPHCRMLGVMITNTADNTAGYMVCSGVPYVLFDAAPTVDGLTYLSVTTAGTLTKTTPPVAATNQKMRNGRVISASASTGRIPWHPESVCVAADGLA